MNIYFSFPYKHTLKHKFCTNRNIFHRDMKENASGCFYLLFRQKKHPLKFFLYLGGKCCDLYKMSSYVCEELGIPSKSKLNIHCYW